MFYSNKTLPGNRVCRWRSPPITPYYNPPWNQGTYLSAWCCFPLCGFYLRDSCCSVRFLEEWLTKSQHHVLHVGRFATNWLTCEMSTIQGEFYLYVRKQVIYRWELFRSTSISWNLSLSYSILFLFFFQCGRNPKLGPSSVHHWRSDPWTMCSGAYWEGLPEAG